MGIEQLLQWCLTQCTSWLSSDTGGAALFGSSALGISLIVGWVGYKAIKWVCDRISGNHLPVREPAQELLTTMADPKLWTLAQSEAGSKAKRVPTVRGNKLTVNKNSVHVLKDKDNWTEVSHSFNRHERKLVKSALTILLRKMEQARLLRNQQDAELTLMVAVEGLKK